ncbi:MAG: 4-alpha-glucanotransferase [Candidatus Limnocylindria bacterium]
MSLDLVEEAYTDALGKRRTIAPEVRSAVVAAMREDTDTAAAGPGVAIVRPGSALPLTGSVTLEDGTELGRTDALPRDVPFGYHRLEPDDAPPQLVITGPGRCHLPAGLRAWGWAIQLAATRSRLSWGIGDLGDLAAFARWSADAGAGFVAVSPLGAPNPGPKPEPSPYYPSTRRFGSPLHVDVASLAGSVDVADLVAQGEALNQDRLIDRARVLQLKREALERIWAAGVPDREAFASWRAGRGTALEHWAIFVVLSERFGPGWHAWPEEFRSPGGAAVKRAASEHADAVTFHAWIQYVFDRQLADASSHLRRIADMPVGVDPGGFDAWDWQDQVAQEMTVGAPPDRFNRAGQDWGLPPFIPHRLRAAGYRPFVDTIRAQLRHAGGLRIDHVLGLFRLWWVPAGMGPAYGAYVRYPTEELLEIVALESHRAEAVVIGEDLGTVPPGVRDSLRRHRLLSTRLVLFERKPPEAYPRQSFAGVTTHDLPTVPGAWSGADLADQVESGITPDPDGAALLRARLAAVAGVGAEAGAAEVSAALHRRVAASPAALVAATLEDALGVLERPNLPGTVGTQRPNWSRALPIPIEDLAEHPGIRSTTDAMRR